MKARELLVRFVSTRSFTVRFVIFLLAVSFVVSSAPSVEAAGKPGLEGASSSAPVRRAVGADADLQGESHLPQGKRANAFVFGSSGHIFAGTKAGIYMSTDKGKHWMDVGLGSVDCLSLTSGASGRIIAGTSEGIYVSTDNGSMWKHVEIGTSTGYVYSFATSSTGTIYAGTDYGVYVSFDGGLDWKLTGFKSGNAYSVVITWGGTILAGTYDGVYSSSDDGVSWTREGLKGKRVKSMVMSGSGDAFAFTSHWSGLNELNTELYMSTDGGEDWGSVSTPWGGSIHTLAADSSGNVYVGTDDGVYRTANDGVSWNALNEPGVNKPVRVLYTDPLGEVIAGLQTGDVSVAGTKKSERLNEIADKVRSGKVDEAVVSLRQYMAAEGIYYTGYTDKFVADFQNMLGQSHKDVVNSVLMELGRLHPQEIIATFTGLARMFTQMEDPETSVEILTRVIANDPGNTEAVEELAEAFYSAGEYDKVIQVFDGSENPVSTRYVALSYEKKGEFEEANREWRRLEESHVGAYLTREAKEHIRKNLIALITSNQVPESPAQPTGPSARVSTTSSANGQIGHQEVASPATVSVDSIVGFAARPHPNAVALILAIQQYQSKDIPVVKYADHDAKVMREYLINTLGFSPDNILPRNPDEKLTYGRILTYVKSILPSYLKPDGSSEVFVYFTGHGAPNTATDDAYLVPWDGDPNYVSNDNAYDLKRFYMDIEKLNARKKIIVIDACFSGQAGNGQTLIKYASPALLRVNNPLIGAPNTVIFQSCGPDQVSNWYDAKRHGMFTYFFLKGLQGAADFRHNGRITAGELIRYIDNPDDGLPYYSNRLYQRPQEAEMDGDSSMVIERIRK